MTLRGLLAPLGSFGAGNGCRFGDALRQLAAGGGHLRARLFHVVLQWFALAADIAQLARAAAQFELRDDVPRQDAQRLILLRAQLARWSGRSRASDKVFVSHCRRRRKESLICWAAAQAWAFSERAD